ncbi:MAG: hypothetical protein D6693_02585 [Planctomycetota bacterium]|nr:MAG: hypothetical protein D6693_02585 [Planctomycetota bacterium]
MADKDAKDKAKPDAENTPAEGAKKGLPIKTIAIVAALLVVEAVVVVGVVTLAGSPAQVQGGQVDLAPVDEGETVGEVLIVKDKFPNHSTGRVWLWDIELQVQIKEKNRDFIEQLLDERGAEIKTGVSRIIRNAHQTQLQEPNLETLSRQFLRYLRDVAGTDADGEERIINVLLPQLVGFPADF